MLMRTLVQHKDEIPRLPAINPRIAQLVERETVAACN